MFIVLEGLTGSGKSTVVSHLVSQHGFSVPELRPEPFRPALAYVEDKPRHLEVRHALFLAAAVQSAIQVEELCASGADVVADSWIYRTMATHLALGSRLEVAMPEWLPVPDLTIILTVDENRRREQIRQRGRASGFWKSACEDHGEAITSWYLANCAHPRPLLNSGNIDDLVCSVDALLSEVRDVC